MLVLYANVFDSNMLIHLTEIYFIYNQNSLTVAVTYLTMASPLLSTTKFLRKCAAHS